MKSSKRAGVLCALAAAAAAATIAVGPAATAATVHPASAQGCTVSTFTVQWSVAGVYGYDPTTETYYQVDTKKYGEVVKAPTGTEAGPYRRIHYHNEVNRFMRKDALNYVRCD